jgi:hypothetical protein
VIAGRRRADPVDVNMSASMPEGRQPDSEGSCHGRAFEDVAVMRLRRQRSSTIERLRAERDEVAAQLAAVRDEAARVSLGAGATRIGAVRVPEPMSATTAAPVFQWSDLANKPTEVGNALDDAGEVTIIRGTQTLRIAQPEHDISSVMREMCGLLDAIVATETPERVCTILNAAWPWTRVLPIDDQIELAAEVGPLAKSCESLDSWRPLLNSLSAWRATARAWASGARPVGPFADPVTEDVQRP